VRDRNAGQGLAGFLDGFRRWHPACQQGAALLLILWLGGLSAIAGASPPDLASLPGIYDGGDYDEVVGLISDLAAVGADSPAAADRRHPGVGVLPRRSVSALPNFPILACHLRSPPSGTASPR
jgi:hypothetical protein